MERIVKEIILFQTDEVLITKTAEVGRLPERREILLRRDAEINFFGEQLLRCDHRKGNDGTKTEIYDLRDANTLITVLDRYLAHQVTTKKSYFSLGWGKFSVCIKQGGTDNLCVCLENAVPPLEAYLTPYEALNMKNCLYHVLGFVASVG